MLKISLNLKYVFQNYLKMNLLLRVKQMRYSYKNKTKEQNERTKKRTL
jgi:hypothetical protein